MVTREMDKNMLMAVCRARVCFGESGKGFMENAALKGGGLPTDAIGASAVDQVESPGAGDFRRA